jgi:hypothetical protein
MSIGQNQETIQKTLESSALFSGGELQPKQFDKFVENVKALSNMIKYIRTVKMDRAKMEIDKLNISEPITRSASENVPPVWAEGSSPLFSKLELSTNKITSFWSITWETLKDNIEREKLERTIMRGFQTKMAEDFENLAINGDTTYSKTSAIPSERLWAIDDGWYKMSLSGHVVDARGHEISYELFESTIRRMPEQYAQDPNVQWIMNRFCILDWVSILARRGDVGAKVLENGAIDRPILGYRVIPAPLIPANMPLSLPSTTLTPGFHDGKRIGPFTFASNAKTLKLDIDNKGAVTITLPVATWQTPEVARYINQAIAADANYTAAPEYHSVAKADAAGRLIIVSPTTGSTSEVDVQAVADDAYTILGLTVGVFAGTDGTTAGTVNEGTFLWFANPMNFIVGLEQRVRFYTEYKKDYDRFEFVAYNFLDFQIEEVDKLVVCKNIRKKQFSTY